MSEAIVVALITGGLALCGTLGGSYMATRRSAALIAYRLDQLEKKVELHNSVIERVYKLEKHNEVQDEQLRVANHRIEDLEGEVASYHHH